MTLRIELNTSKARVRIGGYIHAEHIISVQKEHVLGYAKGLCSWESHGVKEKFCMMDTKI
jgi:hypothetical protein